MSFLSSFIQQQFFLQLFLSLVFFHTNPVINALLRRILFEVVCNMVEAFIPSLIAPGRERLDFTAKATPILDLTILTYLTAGEGVLHIIFRCNLVLMFEVVLKLRHAVIILSTSLACMKQVVAAEGLLLKVLGIFVALPVRLSTKLLVAFWVRAAIWPVVSLQVLVQIAGPTKEVAVLVKALMHARQIPLS